MKLLQPALVLLSIVFVVACGGRTVTRTEPGTIIDLSGYWNDTDARMVADSMVADALEGRWLARFGDAARGERPPRPVVLIGAVFNETSEHINTNLFMNEIERALLESGKVQIAAGGVGRREVRAERRDQQTFASAETAAAFGREIGADFVMTGSIGSIVDEEGSARAIFYQVSLDLIDVETALKEWIGNLEIKKIIEW